MDFWMIDRRDLKNDLLELLTALDHLQEQYDWVISDTDLYFSPQTPEPVRERWSWTGLLMTGQELVEHLTAGSVHFVVGGVFSAVPKGTKIDQVQRYTPVWEIAQFDTAAYRFQTPLTQLELLCYDGSAWVIICQPEFSNVVLRALPMAQKPDDFYRHEPVE